MYYATRTLHLPQGDMLTMQVVEVVAGVVVRWFPFDGELPQMLWEEELFLSYNSEAKIFNDISREVSDVDKPLCLYVLCGSKVATAPVMRIRGR